MRVIADSADFAARAIISRSTSVRFMQHVLQAIHSTRAPVACCKCAEYVSLCLKHWRPQEADRLGDVLDSAIVAAVQSATADARAAGRKAALLLKTILPDRYRCRISLLNTKLESLSTFVLQARVGYDRLQQPEAARPRRAGVGHSFLS